MTLTAAERIDVIRSYKHHSKTFIETGTADGETTANLIDDFDRLITIELDYDRYLHVTVTRFLPHPKVLPLVGDSAKVLLEVAYWLSGPAVFWLDAHYSGGARGDVDTPITTELDIIATHAKGSVVLIDDARLFGVDPAYPTLGWVQGWATAHGYKYDVADDIIRLTPR